jgi:hypothetical protein
MDPRHLLEAAKNLKPAEQISIVGAVIAVLGAIASNTVGLRGQKRQYYGELRKWADEACNTLAEADHASTLDPARMGPNEFFMIRHELSHRISAQIDRGRWFYPNLVFGFHGLHKPFANQGLRQEAINHLVAAYNLVRGLDYRSQANNIAAHKPLIEARRKFVSEVQRTLDPKRCRV